MENQQNHENNEIKKEEFLENSQNPKPKKGISLASSILVSAFLLSGAIIFSKIDTSKTPEVATTSNDVAIPPVSSDDFVFGDPSAEITLIEYSDFSCSFCAKHHVTMHKLVENYPGKVKWVYRHLPIFNKPAAVASQCVGNINGNDAFWKYADILMINQKDINQEFLKSTALNIGVKEGEYEKCINSAEINDKISKEFSQARILAGFNSTPSNVLVDKNGKMHTFSGALSYEDMSALIESVI